MSSIDGQHEHNEEQKIISDDVRILRLQALIYPQLLLEEIPRSFESANLVDSSRKHIKNILRDIDTRLLVIVGPCSIHDPISAIEYAKRLKTCGKVFRNLYLVMRVYFEKPRTTIGWKGLINDPDLDGSFHVNKGLRIARRLLEDITRIGIPVGCEYLDTMIPQYTADLVSWAAIGARTTECQLHRELASGLSMPVGFKNGTTGDIQIAVDAVYSASHPHAFLGITKQALPAVCHSSGNPDCHVILRGATESTNFDEKSIEACCALGAARGIMFPRIVVDFSHGNSKKDFRNQSIVCKEICRQIRNGSRRVFGVMIESHLYEGTQSLPETQLPKFGEGTAFSMEQNSSILEQLTYGVSVTDGCIGFQETVRLLDELNAAVRVRRENVENSVNHAE